jgi:hypothetical protein
MKWDEIKGGKIKWRNKINKRKGNEVGQKERKKKEMT